MPNIRFFRRGVSKVFFASTIAAINAPTAAEVNAGVNLTADLADLAGFTYANQPIATPDWSDNFDSKIPGVDQPTDGVLHFYERTTTNSNRAVLAKGIAGYVVIFFAGTAGASPAAGDKAEVWPITSTGPARDYTSNAEGAKWHVTCTASSRPAVDAVLV